MKIFFTLLFLLLVLGFGANGFAQVTGDFQTKTSSGNWSDFNAWNIYRDGWIPAATGQIPISTSNVYIQPAHTISVDNASAVCNNLYVNGSSSSKIAFSTGTSNLNVKGDMALSSTSHECFSTWSAGAKIIFSGTGNQGFTNLSANAVFMDIEINKASGTLATSSNIRFAKFTLNAGNFSVGSGNEIQGRSGSATISINGGVWSQITSTTRIFDAASGYTFPIGAISINGGTMILSTTTGIGGFQLSTINITNGGTLTLDAFSGLIKIANSLNVDATSYFNTALTTTPLPSTFNFNGVVNYNQAGDQTIPAASYSFLKISGKGIKTLGTGTTTIPNNGTLEMSGIATSPTLALVGTLSVSSTGSNLIYSSSGNQTATSNEWDQNFQNVTINNASTSGVSMAGLTRSVSGSLNLTNGNFDIGTNGALTLSGASLNRVNGFLKGTTTSDLSITGTSGGTVLLPLSGNISLRNITISGKRIMAMNGLNNIDLNGAFNIGSTAAFDNGGESQITNGGGSIVIDGKFLNRDKDDFSNSNGAIPGINPILNATSTIEFGLSGNQFFTARPDFKNITFSGSGLKTPSTAFTPTGTLTITGFAILDAGNHNIGDGVAGTTNFTMDGGRLIVGNTNTQPMMNGLYNLTGGVVQFNFSGATTQSIRSPKTYFNIEVTGNNVGNSSGNITLAPGGTFAVKTGGVFEINDNTITGTGGTQTVTVENGGTFRTGNNEGFNGFMPMLTNNSSIHINITQINLNPGSNVEYSRAGDQPITDANGLIYKNLLLSGSGNKKAPSNTLIVQGQLIKSGTCMFLHNGGTVLLNGTGAQDFAGLTYNNLILTNSTKITSGSSTIIDSIKINAGTLLSISNNDTITLHSDAIRTARLGQLNGGIIIYNATGKFLVERFISSRRAWRFLSVATNSSQSIKQQWQEGAALISSNPKPGYGTQITSNIAAWSTNGFDSYSQGPSVKSYDPAIDTYVGIPSTSTPFDASLGGYMTFVRGDRSATVFGSPVTSTVLRSSGALFTGSQPNIVAKTGKFIPVNNPYASAIDLRNISKSVNLFYYVWDPNSTGSYGLGTFQTLFWNGTDYSVVPGTGSYGATNNFIESGQAFFVGTLGADTSMLLTENAKSMATFAVAPFTPVDVPGQQLRTNLYAVNADGSTFLADGVLTNFSDTYNNAIDGMDARKLTNFGENLFIKSHNQSLVLERRQTLYPNDTLFYNLSRLRAQPYRLEFIAGQLEKTGIEAYLEDNYLKSRILINLNGTTMANFTVDNNAGSAAGDRFHIVFEAAGGPLPVTFTNVNAYQKNKDIALEWVVENERGIKQYEIEKSGNGTYFTFTNSVAANNLHVNNYNWIDAQPAMGYNYYRIKSIGLNGEIQYSKIVHVFISERKQEITIYPNPVKNGIIHLQLINQHEGVYGIRLVNKPGQVIFSKEINHSPGTAIEKIDINIKAAHGIYGLEIIKPDKSKVVKKIVY